jgi:hypothetical protein
LQPTEHIVASFELIANYIVTSWPKDGAGINVLFVFEDADADLLMDARARTHTFLRLMVQAAGQREVAASDLQRHAHAPDTVAGTRPHAVAFSLQLRLEGLMLEFSAQWRFSVLEKRLEWYLRFIGNTGARSKLLSPPTKVLNRGHAFDCKILGLGCLSAAFEPKRKRTEATHGNFGFVNPRVGFVSLDAPFWGAASSKSADHF